MPDPYIDQLLDQDLPCKAKAPLEGRVNTVLHARAGQRGLELCPFPSRAVLLHEIHELILTAEAAKPKSIVNRIAYLGFFEVTGSGMLWVGDRLEVNGKPLGYLAGYDFSHLPNHMNIVVQVEEPLLTGYEMDIQVGDPLRFVFVNGKRSAAS
jgi:hypothetical protein